MKTFIRPICLCLLCFHFIAGCGQSGRLYLPAQEKPHASIAQ